MASHLTLFFVCFLASVFVALAAPPCGSGGFNNYVAPAGVCAWVYGSGFNNPRGITIDSANRILLIQGQSVVSLYDANADGLISNNEKVTIGSQGGLNHAIAIWNGYLYASSNDFVYRWKYTAGSVADLGRAEIVIKGVPGGGNHQTRTMAFDPKDNGMFLGVGSASNVDSNSNRARVVKCVLNFTAVPAGGFDFSSCQVWADGTRNEVGLRLDSKGRLWGVENGRDDLSRPDLNSDAHLNNPAEEVNLFDRAGFYGYPYCWSEFNLSSSVGGGPGTQWADPGFINDGTHSDAWCKNPNNVIKPVYSLPAHVAPLDLIFHNSSTFPVGYQSGIFVTEHGSWNRNPPQGYDVVNLELDANDKVISRRKLLWGNGPTEAWNHRPVGLLKISPCGPAKECLLVTDDGTGIVIAIAANN